MWTKPRKKNRKKLSPLLAEYPDKCLWALLCYINLEEMLNFCNFDVVFHEELAWLCNV